MDLNLINVLYMFFRLSPFIIVSYFSLQSILNQDLKGVIYLIGLIVTSFVVYLIASVLPEESVSKNSSELMKIKCTQCMKKLSMMSFKCKCGNMYCITHQTPHMHKCSYNYKLDLKNKIIEDNPKLGQKYIPI